MDGRRFMVVVLLGVASCRQDWVSESEETVGPGDNITLYCDCKISRGVYIVWYRNCSHENQPSLVLRVRGSQEERKDYEKRLPRFQFVRNHSSESYDLMISNVTSTDEGLYYCGTEMTKVEDKEYITQKSIHTYGKVTTRIILDSSDPTPPPQPPPENCAVCWPLLFSLCPLSAVVSSLFSSLLVYCLCRKKAKETDQHSPDTRGQTSVHQDEDVCYAALEIRQASQRPKRKTQSSDFSTYSAVNTSRM